MFCGKQEKLSNEERCDRVAEYYTRKYRDVPTLSFREWMQREAKSDTYLIDVRSRPERQVSMLEGAMTPTEFEAKLKTIHVDENTRVLVYCTIGYRSGLEARRLRLQYNELDGHVYNTDGIIAFTHAQSNAREKRSEVTPSTVLIEPSTGNNATAVHTFGRMWDFTDDEHYETKHFPPHVLVFRMTQVAGLVVWRSMQRMAYCLRRCSTIK